MEAPIGRLRRTRLGNFLSAADVVRHGRVLAATTALCQAEGLETVHALAHTTDFWPTYLAASELGLRYVLSAHDDIRYLLSGAPHRRLVEHWLEVAWQHASARLVISDEMGMEYCRRYGRRSYQTVTDGAEMSTTGDGRDVEEGTLLFSGAMHISYHPNIRAMADAAAGTGWRFVCRGGAGAQPGVEVRPWADDATIAAELSGAEGLYLPLPFGPRHASFRQYSLPTKLVSYLAADRPILYHGPGDSSVARHLGQAGAAVMVTSLDGSDIQSGLRELRSRGRQVRDAGRKVLETSFRLAEQRRRMHEALAWEGQAADFDP